MVAVARSSSKLAGPDNVGKTKVSDSHRTCNPCQRSRCIITASDYLIPFSSLCSMITRLLFRVRSLLCCWRRRRRTTTPLQKERANEDETRRGERGGEERRGLRRTDRRTAAKEAGEAAPHAIVKTLSLPLALSLSLSRSSYSPSFCRRRRDDDDASRRAPDQHSSSPLPSLPPSAVRPSPPRSPFRVVFAATAADCILLHRGHHHIALTHSTHRRRRR